MYFTIFFMISSSSSSWGETRGGGPETRRGFPSAISSLSVRQCFLPFQGPVLVNRGEEIESLQSRGKRKRKGWFR